MTWIRAEEPLRLDQIPLVDDPNSAESPPELTSEAGCWVRMNANGRQFLTDVFNDYDQFYSTETLLPLAAAFAVAAPVANTRADQVMRDYYQANIRNSDTNLLSEWSKPFGEGTLMLPIFAAASIAGHFTAEQSDGGLLGEWGDRSLRTFIVGAPPMYASQFLTGGSRPGEVIDSSFWRPFSDNNGVSGHAFVGAIPFLSAAMMADDPWLKAGFYGASTLAGLSRINDDAHYTSQAILGWWFAYLAAAAVNATEDETRAWSIVSMPTRDGVMLGMELRR